MYENAPQGLYILSKQVYCLLPSHLWPLLHLLAISSNISSFYNEKVPDILKAAHINSFVSRDIWVKKRAMALWLMKTLFVPYSLCHSWFWNSELVFLGSVIQISFEGRHTVCHNKIFKINLKLNFIKYNYSGRKIMKEIIMMDNKNHKIAIN